MSAKPLPKHRQDYRPPDHRIDRVELDVSLGDETRVRSRLEVRRDESPGGGRRPLVLDGGDLELRALALDGRSLGSAEYALSDGKLTIPDVPQRFVLESEVAIRPRENKRLMGLYESRGIFCTQCEAEGFRRITFFLDRPDVMARYATRIEGDRERFPVMLSNGNRVASGELSGGRHWVRWEDPFRKPCYLFALVAGDLVAKRGSFRTGSGRDVQLEIWVEPRNLDRCEHALHSLQRAMEWDERTFGLECDLDVYMIVAVDDFNMGAMENKGLNLFNSKYVLAKPETATDGDYESIQSVVGHEYFHNWTGNRVTCRDWFQLTLKEGLTVFREQLFTADTTSAPVKRIHDVTRLRTDQFAEDASPMAHPIRPESYVEMNNFYTATVYEKGAEVVRLYHTLLGADGFRSGLRLYLERHDGEAVTCDDFRRAMADAGGIDLASCERWYSQAGTPLLRARGEYDQERRAYRLHLAQEAPRNASGDWRPLPIPVRIGLLGADGSDLPLAVEGERERPTSRLLVLSQEEATYTFVGIGERPVPSLLRGFSAPVRLEVERSRDELAFLLSHDSDPFQRWDAGQELARGILLDLIRSDAREDELELDPALPEALRRVLDDPELDGSFKALALRLPSEELLAQELEDVDPDRIHRVHRFAARTIARELSTELFDTYRACAAPGPYVHDRVSVDRRRLRGRALAYLVATERPEAVQAAWEQYQGADNMTDQETALACLTEVAAPERERALADFHGRWKDDPLVLDKWFLLQALSSLPDTFERVVELTRHPSFRLENPNRARSLLGAFARANQARFHRADGAAYAFLADKILELDGINPQVAARIASAFSSWKRFEPGRRQKMRSELERIRDHPGLSPDVSEIVERSLSA